MFGKLLKYEFKSTAKWYFLITLIALGMSVLAGLFGGSGASSMNRFETDAREVAGGIFALILVIGIVGLYLSNYYIIIRRFYTNLYGREGYLTWTLPAGPHAILLSKFLGALIASLYCLVLLFVSGLLTLLVMGSVMEENFLQYLLLSLAFLEIPLLFG